LQFIDSKIQKFNSNIMSESEKPLDENQVIAKYKDLQSECQSYAAKISELEQELGEHRYVLFSTNFVGIFSNGMQH
jgi:hypothetical protein